MSVPAGQVKYRLAGADGREVSISEPAATALVGRRGVYDREGGVVAFELRSAPVGPAPEAPAVAEAALGEVLGEAGVEGLGTGRPLVVPLPRPFLVGDVALPAEPEQLVVAARADVLADPEVGPGIDRLLALGHRLALDRWDGDVTGEELLKLADLVTVELGAGGVDPAALPTLLARAREVRPDVEVLVAGVAGPESAEEAFTAGATLVSGAACERPRSTGGDLAPSEAVCLQVIGALAEDAPMNRVEQLVSSDPSLPVRVLAMASSAAAAARSISSLRQALVLLGPKRLSEWVLLALLSGTRRLAAEQVVPMLARARACGDLATAENDVAYTAGLLSAIAEVVGADPDSTLRAAHASDEITRAVVDGAGPAGAALRAVAAYEAGDAEGVLDRRFDPLEVSRTYLTAVRAAYVTAASVAG